MGFILDQTSEMGEYHAEVRRESFYISGASTFRWIRGRTDENRSVFAATPDDFTFDETQVHLIEIAETDARPEGDGWVCRYVRRRHGIYVYPDGPLHQGTAEILIEDIPKIRAVLDAVEAHERGRR